jgi:type II secretory pathway component PulF
MPTTTFDYKVRDADGRLVKGQLEADSIPLVAARLRDMGYAPCRDKARVLYQLEPRDQSSLASPTASRSKMSHS